MSRRTSSASRSDRVEGRPAPLGSAFARLWSATLASNLADGVGRTAVPLLAVTLTRDPVLVAGVTAVAFVPWLLFGFAAGILVDRVDRRRAMAAASVIRLAAAAGIAVVIAAGAMSIWLLYAGVLVFGIAETVYENAALAVAPRIVPRAGLDRANSRLQATEMLAQSFVASPAAGLLFAVAIGLPMVVAASGFAVAAALAATLPLAAARAARTDAEPERRSARADAAEAVRFVMGFPFLRSTLVVSILLCAGTSIAQATGVLLLVDRFHVPLAAMGFVTAAIGAGGLLGAIVAGRLVELTGRGSLMLASCLLSAIAFIAAGLMPTAPLVIGCWAIAGFGISLWNVPWGALRQSIVPHHLLGRVVGLTRTAMWGTIPLASLVGGWIGLAGLQLPFVAGGALSLATTLAAARLLLGADRARDEAAVRLGLDAPAAAE